MTKKPPTNKLFKILQKLSTSQLTKLLKLIESPYFHQTTAVKDLFVYLRKLHPHYPLNKVSDEVIAQQLFPKAKNGTKKVKNFKTDLMKLIEQFLILQAFSQQDNQQRFLLAQAYQDLQLPDYANGCVKKITRSIQQSTTRGLPHLYQKLQLSHFQYYHPDTPKKLKTKEKLQDLLNQLDHYFISAKYKYAHEALERMSKLNEQFNLPFWEEVQMEAPNFGSTKKESLIFYYQQLQHLANQDSIDKKYFENLKNIFFKNLNYLNPEDQQAVFKYLLNYITKSLNSGASDLTKLQFDLFKNGLSNNLLIRKNRISMTSFLNIVVLAATCKAFDWLYDFIKKYKAYLNPELHDNVINTAKAFISFRQNEPAQVLSILSRTELKNHNLELFCFPLETKSMFELYLQDQSYYTTIISRLDSLSKRVSTKYGFSAEKKEEYQNYIHFVHSLVKHYKGSKKNGPTINKTRDRIISTNPIIHKLWLLEKCDQMAKQKK